MSVEYECVYSTSVDSAVCSLVRSFDQFRSATTTKNDGVLDRPIELPTTRFGQDSSSYPANR